MWVYPVAMAGFAFPSFLAMCAVICDRRHDGQQYTKQIYDRDSACVSLLFYLRSRARGMDAGPGQRHLHGARNSTGRSAQMETDVPMLASTLQDTARLACKIYDRRQSF